ncbi:MAG TPA: efflux transporter outer membrane subunit [Burkholderiales bacterium]|nr:efflux transporter outer membrane subunit [Burkholderiales bacterium]
MNRRWTAVFVFAACAGCAVGPDFQRPALSAGAGYAREAPLYGGKLADDWWTLFESAQIDALVKDGLAASPNLEAAQAALRASRASLEAGRGVFYPEVDLGASALRQRASPYRLGVAGAASVFNLLTLGVGVNYAIDVFGGNRRAVEKLAAEVDYQRALRNGAYLTLTGNIVNAAIAQSAYAAQLRGTENLIGLERRQAALLEVRWRAGTVAYASVITAKLQLAATEAALPVLRQQLAAAGDLLASLSGKTPAEWSTPPIAFDALKLPAQLPLSLPSELVRQRPDILAAEASLHAASAQVGVATAALYPTVTLGATAGVEGPNSASLGSPNSRYWSFGPAAEVPLFSGFSGVYARDAAKAQYEQVFAEYRQTVVNAFSQVGDALQALQHDAQIEAAQREAFDLAVRQQALAAANRAGGLASELQEIGARMQLEIARLDLVQARALRLQDSTALLVALGRPWRAEPQEARP